MPTGATSPRFDISDFLTRVIPGSVLGFSVAVLVISENFPVVESLSSGWLLLFIIISFIIGEFINTLRVSMLDVPNYFQRILYHEDENEDYLGIVDSILLEYDPDSVCTYSLFEHSDTDIIPELRSRFNLDSDFDGAHNFYSLLTSDLSTEKSQKTSRLESIYIFYENMKLSIALSIGWYILYAILILFDIINQTDLQTAFGFLAAYLVVTLSYIVIMSFGLIAPADKVYVESLLADYFTLIEGRD